MTTQYTNKYIKCVNNTFESIFDNIIFDAKNNKFKITNDKMDELNEYKNSKYYEKVDNNEYYKMILECLKHNKYIASTNYRIGANKFMDIMDLVNTKCKENIKS